MHTWLLHYVTRLYWLHLISFLQLQQQHYSLNGVVLLSHLKKLLVKSGQGSEHHCVGGHTKGNRENILAFESSTSHPPTPPLPPPACSSWHFIAIIGHFPCSPGQSVAGTRHPIFPVNTAHLWVLHQNAMHNNNSSSNRTKGHHSALIERGHTLWAQNKVLILWRTFLWCICQV